MIFIRYTAYELYDKNNRSRNILTAILRAVGTV